MNRDRAYAAARQLIDPDADHTVHARSETGWTQPADPDHQELPGLDVLLAARRVLRSEPTRVETRSDTLNERAGNGQVWLRFTATAADLRYTELLQIQQISATGSELLELLARSVSDDLAVAEIDGLTTRAATVADAFKAALAQARESAHALTAPSAAGHRTPVVAHHLPEEDCYAR